MDHFPVLFDYPHLRQKATPSAPDPPSQYTQPPPYGVDAAHGHPMTTQPRSAWAEPMVQADVLNNRNSSHFRSLTPPPGAGPRMVNMDPDANAKNSNYNINNNTNTNTNNSNNTVVVNANVNAGATCNGNHLCQLTKDRLRVRGWNSGLFSCFNDVVGCTYSAICLPLSLMQLSNRLNECACIACCVPGGIVALRTKLRTMGGIKGSICSDCVYAHFCCYCVACQMKREMDDMNL